MERESPDGEGEWRDVDKRASVLHVRRAYTRGRLKEWGKTERSRRRVPLRNRVLEALDAVPRRLDVPLVFSSRRGGYSTSTTSGPASGSQPSRLRGS